MSIPETIGPYQVLRLLGKGGMGQVFEARLPGGSRPLAVKLLPELLADEDSRVRFEREGELLARVRHRNVVPVLDAGISTAGSWLAMELVEGEELRPAADGRLLSPRQAAALVADVAEGVGALHAAGIIHRDLKPGNVIVRPEGTPVIIDFGLARAADLERLTRTGDMLGTPAYMAPEQASGVHTAAADVYALGAILYHLLTGRPPFVGKSAVEVFRGILTKDPPDPAELGIALDPGLWEIVRRTLAKDPARRPPSAAALREQLRAWVAATGTRRHGKEGRRVPLPLLLVAVASVGLFAGLSHWLEPEPERTILRAEEPELSSVGDVPTTVPGRTLDLVVIPRGKGLLQLEAPGYSKEVRPGVQHPFTLTLPAGPNALVVTIRDDQGREAALPLKVHAFDLPEWFAKLSGERRPPFPLPPGLEVTREKEGIYRNAVDGSELVWIPPGRVGVVGKDVAVEGFYLGRTEVTLAQFEMFWDRARDRHPAGWQPHPELLQRIQRGSPKEEPIATISWEEAQRYCAWAGLRLPRVVEWERAARGDDGRTFPWGHSDPFDPEARANLPGKSAGEPFDKLAPVGSFPLGESDHGCLDLAGNVAEWADDLHPLDGFAPDKRSVCGGSACGWTDPKKPDEDQYLAPEVLCAVGRRRSPLGTNRQYPAVGFRVARSAR